MSYFCIFNTRGCLIFEEGISPSFLNNIILSLDISKISGSMNVRDEKIEYEVRGPIIYLSVGSNVDLHYLIDKQKNISNNNEFSKNDIGKNETNKNILNEYGLCKEKLSNGYIGKDNISKNNSLKNNTGKNYYSTKKTKKINKNITDEEKLNYSSSSTITQKLYNTTNIKKTIIKNFNLFSNKIHVNELKDKMELHLVKKNVDYEITKIITECVLNKLREEKIEYVSQNEFKKQLTIVLSKLIPSIDHTKLLSTIKNNSKTKIFTFCFVGVNGVGKSTSLAKMCYWLLQNNFKVFIAACDTFRAGAIEQLKIHVERFRQGGYNVGFYEKGYGKDDASVASTAIKQAQTEGYDVVLIDTAGRMHNKSSLMDSLSKLIRINEPDHIIYVGEALVGADSLNHIKEFNKSIKKGSSSRSIDSILLTKVDTVDDKIGQILNMTFSSHAPVLFLGTGQTNSDLTVIASDVIVNSLLS